ncbi:hypothetical protein [Vibrio hippocampi]|uniref:Uncharacterized protein n=1 Tax=Vibrio hippocampi TaxID=654686 RepID=A0ABN8DLQ9_9VIBR|nr:hypothetical protein [Vibrio hippocampi]CAH0530407.1 hypothetical protein VHP8226_04050 [Vibrio hippocampi]
MKRLPFIVAIFVSGFALAQNGGAPDTRCLLDDTTIIKTHLQTCRKGTTIVK